MKSKDRTSSQWFTHWKALTRKQQVLRFLACLPVSFLVLWGVVVLAEFSSASRSFTIAVGVLGWVVLSFVWSAAIRLRMMTPARQRLHRRHVLERASVKAAVRQLSGNRQLKDFYAPAGEYTTMNGGRSRTNEKARTRAVAQLIKVQQTDFPRFDPAYERKFDTALQAMKDKQHENLTVVLPTVGEARAKVEKLAESVKSALNLYDYDLEPADRGGFVSIYTHKENPVKLFDEVKVDAEWFIANHPALNPLSFPLAITDELKPWNFPLHHTIIGGLTGAGKGSVIQSIIHQNEDNVMKHGLVEFYGVDPGDAELTPYKHSAMFTDLATGGDEASLEEQLFIVEKVHARMLERMGSGRSLKPSRETPVIILLADEVKVLLEYIKDNRLKEPKAQLENIASMGRKYMIFSIVATQNLDKELFGRMRDNYVNRIALRQENQYWNDLLQGQGASDLGYRAQDIPPALPANNFASAGVAYVKDEFTDRHLVRFPYIDDARIAALVERTRI